MPDILIKAPKKNFKKGETIFTQGDAGDEMYIIQKGSVNLTMHISEDKTIPLANLGPKKFFGEMALFDDPKRTATAIAVEDTTVLVINSHAMKLLMSKLPPWFVIMFKTTIGRLRDADTKLIDELKKDSGSDKTG